MINFKFVLTLIKKYWFLALLAGAAMYHYVRMDNVKQLLDIANKSHKTQITELRKLHSEEIKGRDDIIKTHEVKIEKIDKKYKMAKWALRKEREKTIKEIQKETPEQLIERIEKTFGLRHIPRLTK